MRETNLKLPGYQLLTPLHESGDSLVYRALKESDRTSVVVKVLKDQYPSPDKLNEYSWEFEINQLLKDRPGIVHFFGMERTHNSLFIVQEDFGAESLASLIQGRKLELEEQLHIATQIADALGIIHRSDIIHCNLCPANILVNPKTLQVKITDFGLASFPSKPRTHLSALELPAEALPYISPEQTGRMNRKIDHRSDFYSLGVTLFELLTGRRPFESTEPLELIHAHIAKPPPTAHMINPALPRVLSDIVLRLLAKNPKERYRSAIGIKADLDTCLRLLRQTGSVPAFELGAQDVSERLQIPALLYGRDQETKRLIEGFEHAAAGGKNLFLVAGPSGIGKSTYVQQLRASVVERGGFFILGKFELLQRDTPYEAFVSAFQQLTEQLLTESEQNLSRWKERILKALEPNAQVLIEVIPDLKLILGAQENAEPLPPAETQNRFNLVVQRFIKLFAKKNHPLVLFLDDLQWADSASLNLLELLMTSQDIQSLYLIGTYRDNEVSAVHPLMQLIERLREKNGRVEQITLSNLQARHVTELVADTFRTPLDQARALAELIHSKTDGNPFFVNEFLQMLSAKNLVAFAPEAASWTWDLEQIKTQNITDNVAKLMGQKLQLLPPEVRDLLDISACVGNQFTPGILKDVSGLPAKVIQDALGRACEMGLLVPVAAPKHDAAPDPGSSLFRFSHNRVHQAVYARIAKARRLELHREIGKALFSRTPEAELDTRIFDIVAQFNLISELLEAAGEKEALIQLNLKAGRKAKASAAVEPALRYFNIARELLGEGGWETHYALILELTEEAAEAASLLGDQQLTEKLTRIILDRARSPLERSRAYQIRIVVHNARKEPR